MNNDIEIKGRRVGSRHPVYIVAELSANHGQKFEQAAALIREAHAAGADAVKLQTYTPDTLTLNSDRECFYIGNTGPWAGKTLYELYKEAYTPWDWQPKLKKIADELGITLFSSPFDFSAVDFLEDMDVPAYKIASFELVDLPLIKRVAATGKPIILSTGMANISEIDAAVSTARAAGSHHIVLLKCTSGYPALAKEMNLRTIPHLAEAFNLPVGLSDHTLGAAVPIAAITLGAVLVEKHLTLTRSIPGPDTAFSLEPAEFKIMVEAIRMGEQALGGIHYGASESESQNLRFRRSLFITEKVNAGQTLTPANLRSVRPNAGLSPRHYDEVLGREVVRDVEPGTPLTWSLIR